MDRRRGFLTRLKRSPAAASVAAAIGVVGATLVARPITIGDLIFAPQVEVTVNEARPVEGQAASRRGLNSYTMRVGSNAAGLDPALVFASGWSAATGTGDAAIYDDSLWVNIYGEGAMEVVATTTEGFSTTNFLAATVVPAEQQRINDNWITTFDSLEIGHQVGIDYEFQYGVPSYSGSDGQHCDYFTYQLSAYSTETPWSINTNDHDTDSVAWTYAVESTPGNDIYWGVRVGGPNRIAKDHTYRFSLLIERTHTDSMDVEVELYDVVGDSVMYSTADYECEFCGSTTYLDERNVHFDEGDIANFKGWRIGCEGIGDGETATDIVMRYAAFRMWYDSTGSMTVPFPAWSQAYEDWRPPEEGS